MNSTTDISVSYRSEQHRWATPTNISISDADFQDMMDEADDYMYEMERAQRQNRHPIRRFIDALHL